MLFTFECCSTPCVHAPQQLYRSVQLRCYDLRDALFRGEAARAEKSALPVERPGQQHPDSNVAHQSIQVCDSEQYAWRNVVCSSAVRQSLFEAIVLPIVVPTLFQSRLLAAPSFTLLYGPPGTGKTLLAKCVAHEVNVRLASSGSMERCTFFSVSPASLLSKWTGQSEKAVQAIFNHAKTLQPALIFMDEIDSLCTTRGSDASDNAARRLLTEILIQTSKVKEEGAQVTLIGATNQPGVIDPGMYQAWTQLPVSGDVEPASSILHSTIYVHLL